ncbi:MAG: GIY-YIG nuclease family protein [Coriobacteriia bacterium]|nr:GIY-YIG nuclease family protein [Coriobacteriia bacterium]
MSIDRKALTREYKRTPRPAGVFQVRNIKNGRVLIGPTSNLPGILNRLRFELELGTHPDNELQADWDSMGPEAFEFGVLDRLEQEEGEPGAEDLRILHQLWLERLSDTPLYSQSSHGA